MAEENCVLQGHACGFVNSSLTLADVGGREMQSGK
jgi:hypothetical protein